MPEILNNFFMELCGVLFGLTPEILKRSCWSRSAALCPRQGLLFDWHRAPFFDSGPSLKAQGAFPSQGFAFDGLGCVSLPELAF